MLEIKKPKLFMKLRDGGEYKPVAEIKEVALTVDEPRHCFGKLYYKLNACQKCEESDECLKRKIENRYNRKGK